MKKMVHSALLAIAGISLSQSAFASGGGQVHIINYYEIILHNLGLDAHAIEEWFPVLAGLLTTVLISLVGFKYKAAVAAAGSDVTPDSKFGIRPLVEMILEFVSNLGRDVIGDKESRPFLPLLAGMFLFIFVSNLTGLVPGFPPATESINTNLAIALSVFVVYNYAGIKEHGGSYIKQFLGPVAFMMPLFLLIELVAHLARPLSLSLRLYGNIFGDHLVLSVFTGLTYLVLPAFLLFFGLLVASIQSFVFTLLSSIYISMAISHDH